MKGLNKETHNEGEQKMKTSKKAQKSQETKDYGTNVIQFSSVKKTKSGYAVFVGKNVIFINQGLLDYINKNNRKAS